MLTNQERYFIWNIIHPCNELKNLIGLKGKPIYNDDQYSLLKERVGLLCTKVLHIFEQPEFSSLHGKTKREELNQNDKVFHRILSYGIKEKHFSITNRHYSDFALNIPLSAYVFSSNLKYDYFYHPMLKDDSGKEFSLLEDLAYCINSLISLYSLNIRESILLFQPSPKYDVVNNTVELHLIDTYNYLGGMTSSINVRTFELSHGNWLPVRLPFQIDFKVFSPSPNA